MPRLRTRIAAVALLVALPAAGMVAAGALSNKNAGTRGVVLFVGDSNVTSSSGAIVTVLTTYLHLNNGYVPVIASRPGAAIRTHDCLEPTNCTTFDYWKLKLATVLPKVRADAIVTDFGVIDALSKGTATTPGYAFYGRKINWFMNLTGGRPVFWTTLPCQLEPLAFQTGCKTVNFELYRALHRWPNLHIIEWANAANAHPEYMWHLGTDVHYSATGQVAWAKIVVAALDARYPRV